MGWYQRSQTVKTNLKDQSVVTAEVQPYVAQVKLVLEITTRTEKLNNDHNQKKQHVKKMYKNKSQQTQNWGRTKHQHQHHLPPRREDEKSPTTNIILLVADISGYWQHITTHLPVFLSKAEMVNCRSQTDTGRMSIVPEKRVDIKDLMGFFLWFFFSLNNNFNSIIETCINLDYAWIILWLD